MILESGGAGLSVGLPVGQTLPSALTRESLAGNLRDALTAVAPSNVSKIDRLRAVDYKRIQPDSWTKEESEWPH